MPTDNSTTAKAATEAAKRATDADTAKRDARKRAASQPTAAEIDAAKKPADKPAKRNNRAASKPADNAAITEAATEADKPKRESHRDKIARERYTGASKPIRRGFRLSPVMLDKACNGLSDRTRDAMLDIRDAYGTEPFSRLDYDAGILGFLCYLGYAEHVTGTGSIKRENGHVYACGSDAKFRLTAKAAEYGNGVKPKA